MGGGEVAAHEGVQGAGRSDWRRMTEATVERAAADGGEEQTRECGWVIVMFTGG